MNLFKLIPYLSFFILLTLSISYVHAEEAPPQWTGEAELGVVSTSGNTDTKTLNTKLKLRHERGRFTHDGSAYFLYSSDTGRTTAQRLVLTVKDTYHLREVDYLFVSLRYEDDLFSGYEYRFIETVGYGRHFFHNSLTIAVEAGPGGRHSKFMDGTVTDEFLFRVSGNLVWRLTESTSLTEDLSTETGYSGTVIESTTALKSRIIGNLAMKTSVEVRYNTEVPQGVKKMDITTSVTLVYTF